MNHITLARQLFITHNVREQGFGAPRREMLKMGLSGHDISKVTEILKHLSCH